MNEITLTDERVDEGRRSQDDHGRAVPGTAELRLAYRRAPWFRRGWVHRCAGGRFGDGGSLVSTKAKRNVFNWSRCEEFAQTIDVDMSEISTEAICAVVLAVIEKLHLTTADFIELDERPGLFYINGQSYTRTHWHRNLRVTRNSSDKLFDLLKVNSR